MTYDEMKKNLITCLDEIKDRSGKDSFGCISFLFNQDGDRVHSVVSLKDMNSAMSILALIIAGYAVYLHHEDRKYNIGHRLSRSEESILKLSNEMKILQRQIENIQKEKTDTLK